MARLYCYEFDGYKVKEGTVEVVETEKQYRVESGNVPFAYKSKVNKSELGLQARGYVYISTLPAYDEAVEAFIHRDEAYLRSMEFNADRAKERLNNLYKIRDKEGTDT